jgi:hypothetical protein
MRRAVRWGIVLGALAAAAPAWADDTAQRDAQARFEEGVARLRSNNLAGALLSFQQAYAVAHKPVIVWNLALTEEKTNRPLDALAHFKEFVRLTPSTDPDRPNAQSHIDALNAATGHIDVEAPTGAGLTMDGTQSLGPAPLADRVDVQPGHHELQARFGNVVKTITVDAVAGQTSRADFSAIDPGAPPAGAAAVPSGGDVPPPPVETPPPAPEQSTAPASSTARLVTVVALGGAAVLASGAGLAFGIASSNEASSATALRQQLPTCAGISSPDCQRLASDVAAQQNDHVISTAMWIVGGVLAVGAVGAYVLWPRRVVVGTVSASVVPVLGAGSAGLVATGTF